MADTPEKAPQPQRPKPPARGASKWPARIGILVFLIIVGGIFATTMLLIAPGLKEYRQDRGHLYSCVEILRGDRVKLVSMNDLSEYKEHGSPYRIVDIAGILAPPMTPGPEQEAFLKRTGRSTKQLEKLARISKNALVVWLFKQENLTIEELDVPPLPGGDCIAHVQLALVDVGKIQLREGQVMLREQVSNEHAEAYAGFEAAARDGNKGIWRN